MPEEGFLRRWARRKTEVREGLAPEPAPEPETVPLAPAAGAAAGSVPLHVDLANDPDVPAPSSVPEPARLPTMEDVAALTKESDYAAFVARGVDQAVRRSALKKLFTDPHFKAMDGLDIYIDDYTGASPVSKAMLAGLQHAKSVFQRQDEDADATAQPAPHTEPVVETAVPEAPMQAAPQAPTQNQQSPEPEQETQ